jgi:hypothetical protein
MGVQMRSGFVQNVTVEEVCAATGLGPRQVYKLTREGRIPAALLEDKRGYVKDFVMTRVQFEQLMREGIGPKRPEPSSSMLVKRPDLS